MQLLSMQESNFPMCNLPCLAYTANITHKYQEPA